MSKYEAVFIEVWMREVAIRMMRLACRSGR